MCQWKFFVLRYRAKKSVSKRVSAPAISLVASDLRSVGVSNGASRRAFTFIESIAWSPCRVFRLAMSFARAAGRPSSGYTRWRQDRSDACAMLSLLDRTCGSLCGSISARRAAAMIGGAWPPPAGRADRCQHLADGCRLWDDAGPSESSFHGLPGWQAAQRVGGTDQAMISL